MKLKNFYVSKELDQSIKYAAKIYMISEGEFIRQLIEVKIPLLFPKSINGEGVPRAIRENIYKKYKYKCKKCKKELEEISKRLPYNSINRDNVTYKSLDIHHRDGIRINNHVDNLILLCKSCHKIAERKSRGVYPEAKNET